MTKVKLKRGRPAKVKVDLSNPFQIVTNKELKGNRATSPFTEKLTAAIMSLPAKDKMKSIFVPLSIAGTRTDAQNLILAARRLAKEKHDDYVFSCKFSFENNDVKKGKYLGANVWRIN